MDQRHKEFFADADTDGNGAISKDEMKAHHQKMKAKRFGDSNGDGVVDRSEYDAASDARFDKLDADKDGVISEDEMKAGHRGHHGKHGGR